MAEPQESGQVEEQKARAEPAKSRQEEEQKAMAEPPESRQTEPHDSRDEEEGECMGEAQQQEEQTDMAEAQECNIVKEQEDMAGEPQQQIEEQKDTDRMHSRTNLSKKRAREEASSDDGTSAVDETRWPGWPGYNVFRLLVPAHKVGAIIGHRGGTIQNIRAETRSRIKIIDGGLTTHNCSERVVMVSAKEEPDEQISPAMNGILRVHKLLIDLPQDLDQVAAGGDRQLVVTRMLLAGDSQAPNIIGKQGATIRDIQEKSGADFVRVLNRSQDIRHECALPDDQVLEIRGEPAKVHEALALVVSHLRKFLVDLSILPLFESNIMSRQHQPWSRNRNDYNQTTTGTGGSGSGQSSSSSQIVNQYSTISRPPQHGAGPGPYYDPQEIPPLETEWREAPSDGDQFTAEHSNPSPAPPVSDEHHLEMQFPLRYADVVIGNSGEYITYFRSTSGAIINIEETRGMAGQITIDILGNNSEVHRAEQLILDAISAADSGASGTSETH